MTDTINQVQISDSVLSKSSHPQLPAILSFKEIIEERQKRLQEKAKSAEAINVIKNIATSPSKITRLPYLKPKYQPASLVKSLEYDFGTLSEFLDYDLKLKKPEEMFKIPEKGKKIDPKSKEDDLKKVLMHHMKYEIETRDAKTVLIEEKDREKVSKAVKKFVTDMVEDIFKDELSIIETKKMNKGISRLHEFIMDLDDDNPIRKIAERYGHKSLVDKFNILENEIDKRRNPENHRAPADNKPKINGLSNKVNFAAARRGSILYPPIDSGSGRKPNLKHFLAYGAKQHPIFGAHNLSNFSGKNASGSEDVVNEGDTMSRTIDISLAKPKPKQASEGRELTFALKLITESSSLSLIQKDESVEKEKEIFAKDFKQAEEFGKVTRKDLYTVREGERVSSIAKHHFVFTYSEFKPQFFLYTCLQFQSFSTLYILNVRGCGLHESLVWLMLSLIERFNRGIRLIDISGNQVTMRICESLKHILIKNELQTLKIVNTGLKSKGLATICLGLAENDSLVDVDFSYNEIDEYGFQTLALILRYTQSLKSVKILRKKKKIISPTGEENEIEEELGYTAMTMLNKAFKYNKHLDPKNVLLFEPKAN